ncbi:MAG: hypothetical protein ACNA78_09740 [Balneolaceae bacterium]
MDLRPGTPQTDQRSRTLHQNPSEEDIQSIFSQAAARSVELNKPVFITMSK